MRLWERGVLWLYRAFGGVSGALLKEVRLIAEEVVQQIDQESGLHSDEDKRKLAFLRIHQRAIEQGIGWAPHVINLAIEMAVTSSKLQKARRKR
ncbi:MAG: hypothetical protein D6736_16155 [Nitrospinota bacterium]|nr:MAG: hypothetical protein D6736_16155 [Nitrospinota bacterium]